MIHWTSQFQQRLLSPLASHQFSHKHSYSIQLVMNQRLATTRLQEVLPPLCDVLVCLVNYVHQNVLFNWLQLIVQTGKF